MTAYYNEIDPFAAQWLRNLINAGHIAPGDVDERSIEDVRPGDLKKYTQCHFFAGIGVWSHALRTAGWEDERPVWTGSCPCQSFSSAGKRKGFADERHLWPAWQHLIAQRHPDIVFGEQVASKDGYAWLDLVWTDMEGLGYAFGPHVSPAAGYGAPEERHRQYWVAYAEHEQHERRISGRGEEPRADSSGKTSELAGCSAPGDVEHDQSDGRKQWGSESSGRGASCGRSDERMADLHGSRQQGQGEVGRPCDPAQGENREIDRVDHDGGRSRMEHADLLGKHGRASGGEQPLHFLGSESIENKPASGPVNGFWGNADWLFCRDGKWRPVESGAFPLAHGVANRMGLLRGYGNAIVKPQAVAFIQSFKEIERGLSLI